MGPSLRGRRAPQTSSDGSGDEDVSGLSYSLLGRGHALRQAQRNADAAQFPADTAISPMAPRTRQVQRGANVVQWLAMTGPGGWALSNVLGCSCTCAIMDGLFVCHRPENCLHCLLRGLLSPGWAWLVFEAEGGLETSTTYYYNQLPANSHDPALPCPPQSQLRILAQCAIRVEQTMRRWMMMMTMMTRLVLRYQLVVPEPRRRRHHAAMLPRTRRRLCHPRTTATKAACHLCTSRTILAPRARQCIWRSKQQ